MDQPNVVFVLTDDQGFPPLGANGHSFINTPNLDQFHSQSVHFEDFHTGTTCAPTRAGLLTGHHCNSTGVWHTVGGRSLLQRDEWSLADALRENGYRTGIFGKWHLGDEYPYRPQDRGFDTVVCHGGGGISQQPDWWGNDYFDDTYLVNGEPKEFDGYCTDVFFDEALKFIENNRKEPFFCYISTNAPHGPFNVEPHYRDMYSEDTENEKYARFLGMITNIDENFGRLRSKLRELKLEDNTILIFMSDNGQTGNWASDPYNAGMRGMKGTPYEGGHRVPFMVRWPKGGYNQVHAVEELTSYVDFMPTVLDLCNISVPRQRQFHGESLVPLMDGKSDDFWHNRTFVTDTQRVPYPMKWRKSCAMKNKWRLVNRDELYNLETDLGQTKNIAERHPEVVAELRDVYEDWWHLCSQQMGRDIPLSIGAEKQQETVLRTHDLRTETDDTIVWNQAQVRQGKPSHGYWEIFVESDGTYEFELRRWPKEAGHAIGEGVNGDDIDFRRDGIAPGAEALYSGGNSIEFDVAHLEISGIPRQETEFSADDSGVIFRVDLPRGLRHLRARFSSCSTGFYCSAYYVYIRKL